MYWFDRVPSSAAPLIPTSTAPNDLYQRSTDVSTATDDVCQPAALPTTRGANERRRETKEAYSGGGEHVSFSSSFSYACFCICISEA